MSKLIPLSQGEFAIVDDDDYGAVNCLNWFICKANHAITKYAMFKVTKNKKEYRMYMHRYILDTPKDMTVDHINGNGLDNRRENLRVCTHRDNSHNNRLYKNNKTGYKGVIIKNKKQICAQIKLRNTTLHIGRFESLKDAALAYDKKAIELYGEFASTNKKLGLL